MVHPFSRGPSRAHFNQGEGEESRARRRRDHNPVTAPPGRRADHPAGRERGDRAG